MIGRTISHYRIIEPLGAGGMGEVYLAEDVRLGRKLAVKVLASELVTDADRVRRFGLEARAVSALNHPNILTIHDIGQDGDLHFIATEFVDGETLRAYLDRTRPGIGRALEIAIQAGSALAAAHEAGIVHRDVKPENVMLRPDGYVKVLDFGLAKLTGSAFASAGIDGLTHTVSETHPGMVLGTFTYMSPEQARGEAADARSDVFSLGVVLYEMLTGRAPFRGATPADVLGAILYVHPAPVSQVAGVPDLLDRVVSQAIGKSLDARYPTMGALVDDLKTARRQMERGFIEAPGTDRLPSTASGSFASQGPRESSHGSGASALSDVQARGDAPRRRTAKRRIDSLAVLPLENASNDPEMEYLSDGITETMINSLSQLPKLRVMARSTVFRYKGHAQDPQTIGRDLGVRAVLTGRVLQRGDRLVVGAELVDVEDGSQIWGSQFNRRLSGIFELQEELSSEMTDTLRLRLTGDQKKRLARPASRAVEAYQAFLKGRFLVNKRTPKSFADAVPHFQEAIIRDPEFAAAHAAMGEVHALSVTLGFGLASSRTEAVERARAGAARALALDDSLPEAHALAAYLKFRFDWDWPGAEAEFTRALELNPGHAPSRHAYALFLGSRGRHEEALHEMQRARELDPLSLVVVIGIGRILHLARRFDDALAQYRRGIEMDPSFDRVHFDVGLTLIAMGAYDEAIEAVKKFSTGPGGRPFALVLTTISHALAGRLEAARSLIGSLEQRHRDGAMGNDELTMVYAVVGESRKAAEVLVRACEERATALSYAGVEPVMAFLRNDPECRPILEREGLLV